MTYDGNGNLTESTDSRSKTVSYTYDALNRKTASYAAAITAQSASNQLTALFYDNSNNAVTNMPNPKGQLTTATAFWNGQPYTTQVKGFNAFGAPTGQTVTVPPTEGGLAGDYVFTHIYTPNSGLPLKTIYPNKGGLPSETVLYGYDAFDQVDHFGGLNGYLNAVTQDAYGRINSQTLGSAPNQASIINTYDEHTGRLKQQLVTRTPTTPGDVDKQNYDYDLVGNVTRHISTRLDGASAETQCYTYDQLRRLTEAWTATDNCTVAPTTANHTMVGNTIGGNSAYWTSWTFDSLGNRSGETQHNLTGPTDSTTNYTYNGNNTGQPHTLTSTSTTGSATGSATYGYDTAGNMITRNTDNGSQTLTWNNAGQLTSIANASGTSNSLYDAAGNLLLQKDPGSVTLYLPNGQQHTLNTTTQVVAGVRSYPFPGGGTALRTGTGTNYTFALADTQGTPTLYLNNTAQLPTWRQYAPYGKYRGVAVASPDNHGFLNKPVNTRTGLIRLGAREYDSSIGRFISVDPLMSATDPQQWNGYAYSNNSPVTFSDPTGLIWINDGGGNYVPPCMGSVNACEGPPRAPSASRPQRPGPAPSPNVGSGGGRVRPGSRPSPSAWGDGGPELKDAHRQFCESLPRTCGQIAHQQLRSDAEACSWVPYVGAPCAVGLAADDAQQGHWGAALIGIAAVVPLGKAFKGFKAAADGIEDVSRAASRADNAANGVRLADQLKRQGAFAIFKGAGKLHPDVIAGSRRIIGGDKLNNPKVIEALTADGSDISDWGKYTSQTYESLDGPFQVHFYHNPVTGATNYSIDAKIVYNVAR
ncbi:RHS repeat domain-containing protein [Micromonospora aurantiaca (nom. illeg.)]